MSNVVALGQTSSRFRSPPATTVELLAILADLDVVFPSPAMTTEERSRRYQIYCREIAYRRYPKTVVEMSASQYTTAESSVYFPPIGKLLALCESNAWKEETLRQRARPERSGPL